MTEQELARLRELVLHWPELPHQDLCGVWPKALRAWVTLSPPCSCGVDKRNAARKTVFDLLGAEAP